MKLDDLIPAALSSRHTLRSSYALAKAAIEAGVPGDFVECGVFAGAQCAAMARAVMESGSDKRVHLFDSFEGIPQAGPHDVEFIAAGHPPGLSKCDLASVRSNMAAWHVNPATLVYHPGSFPAAFHEFSGAVSVLRLDADLYESTKLCLEYFLPLLSPGGWVIVDDFDLSGCRKAVFESGPTGPIYFQRH